MRNLTKVLALVLSLAFVLSCMTGAIQIVDASKFTDVADFTAAGKKAIYTLNALGIVHGNPDGSFAPTADVTRQEFIKMASIAGEGVNVETQYACTSIGNYTDVAGQWGIAYMNYGYLKGIMVGYGDNTMRPQSNVTGYEATKMMLVTLGYDAKTEGLEGPGWMNRTVKLASDIGLLKNVENYNLAGAFNREASAILIYNALYTGTVSYGAGVYATKTGETLGEEVFDLLTVYGIVVENKWGALGLNWTNDVFNALNNKADTLYVNYNKQISADQTVFAFRDFTGASTIAGYYEPKIVVADIASDYADLGRSYLLLTTRAKNLTYTAESRKVYGVLWEVEDAANYRFTNSILSSDAKVVGTGNKISEVDTNTYGLTYKVIANMYRSALRANASVGVNDIQYNIWIDGAAKSYSDADKHIAKYEKSSAPFKAVDNDNDGIVDSLFLYTYKAAKVLKVDAENKKLTMAGIGEKTIANLNAEIAVDGYVAYYADKQYAYADKLNVFTGTVSGYSDNSGTEPDWLPEGIGVTKPKGTYTINGVGYSFGSLAENLGADERQYFEQLMGSGTASVADVVLQYVVDGKYIVAAFVTDETHWTNYAIVIGWNNIDVTLGMKHIRLYTEDNEYKDFYVASIDGNQIYNNIVSGTTQLPRANMLVRYEEIGNNRIALYNADYVNASDHYEDDKEFAFEQKTGVWLGYDYPTTGVQRSTMYNWDNGVVFVTYGAFLEDVDTFYYAGGDSAIDVEYDTMRRNWAYQWRAYFKGEFQPAYADEANIYASIQAKRPVGEGGLNLYDEVVYADSLNNVMTLKAAKISFQHSRQPIVVDAGGFNGYAGGPYILPGLVLREGQAIWGTVMGLTYFGTTVETEDFKPTTKYVYKVNILLPWSAGTKEITIYTDVRNATFTKGDVYKMYMNDDGICRRWEIAATSKFQDAGNGTFVFGTDYLEASRFVVTGIIANGSGGYTLQVKYPLAGSSGDFSPNVDYLTMTADTDAYFTKNLFTTDVESVNWLTMFGGLGYLSMGNHDAYSVYADINPTTKEVYSIWFNDEPANSFVKRTLTVELLSYDEETMKATYGIKGIRFKGGNTTAIGDYLAYETITVIREPQELIMQEGYPGKKSVRELPVYCSATEDGGWIVYNFKTDVEGRDDGDVKAHVDPATKVTLWNASNATKVLWDDPNYANKLAVYGKTKGDAGAVDTVTKYSLDLSSNTDPTTQIWWITEYGDFRRIEAAAGDPGQTTAPRPGTVWASTADAVDEFKAANDDPTQKLSYDPLKQIPAGDVEGKYTYQSFYVVTYGGATIDGIEEARIIVLVNTSADALDNTTGLLFPYAPIT